MKTVNRQQLRLRKDVEALAKEADDFEKEFRNYNYLHNDVMRSLASTYSSIVLAVLTRTQDEPTVDVNKNIAATLGIICGSCGVPKPDELDRDTLSETLEAALDRVLAGSTGNAELDIVLTTYSTCIMGVTAAWVLENEYGEEVDEKALMLAIDLATNHLELLRNIKKLIDGE